MKKLLLTTLILFGIGVEAANATVWQYGLYQERAEMAAMCGIFGYRGTAQQNLSKEVQDCFKAFSGEVLGFSVITRYRTTLSSSMTSSQTTIPVSSMKTFDGDAITMAMLGSKVYLTVEPGSNREEIIKCTGISGSSWTGCTRGLAFSGTDETSVAANRKAHNAGSTVVISNVHYVYEELIDKDTNATSTGNLVLDGGDLTAEDILATSTMCLTNTNYCFRVNDGMIQWTVDNFTNSYNFTSSTISQLTASSTRAIGVTDGKVHLNISDNTGLVFDNSTGYLDMPLNNSITSGTDGLAVNTSTNFTWTGENTFNATTTFSSPTTTYGIWNNKISLVAGEAILRGDAVSIAIGTSTAAARYLIGEDGIGVVGGKSVKAQTFKTSDNANSITEVEVKIVTSNTAGTLTASIRSVSGSTISASDLGSKSVAGTALPTGSADWYKITFDTPISVSPMTTYALVLKYTVLNDVSWSSDDSSPSYTNGSWFESSNSGATFSANTNKDFLFIIREGYFTAGQIRKSSGFEALDNFIGFASNSASPGDSVDIIVNGIAPIATSTLTIGNLYYLSDTFGEISMSPTTNEKQVGIAIDTDKILIRTLKLLDL